MKGYMVSIQCITYNHESYISKAIDSFLMQDVDFDYEILIGEDYSNDGTRAIVQSYVEQYPDKIKMITSDENVGSRANSKRLNEVATGKYIALCEGDDYWTDPDKLNMQVKYMEGHEECSFTFHAAQYIDGEGNKIDIVQRPFNHDCICPISDLIVQGGGFTATASIVYRKDMFDHTTDFYINSDVGDYPRQIALASAGSVYYFDRIMSDYRYMHAGSWTINQSDKSRVICHSQSMIEMLKSFNQHTLLKYDDYVQEAIREHEFRVALSKNDLKTIKDPKYKVHWYGKTTSFRIKTYLRIQFPGLYRGIQRVLKRV